MTTGLEPVDVAVELEALGAAELLELDAVPAALLDVVWSLSEPQPMVTERANTQAMDTNDTCFMAISLVGGRYSGTPFRGLYAQGNSHV